MGQWGFFDDESDNAMDAWSEVLDRAFDHKPPKSLQESRRKLVSSVKIQLETETNHETIVGLILLTARFLGSSLQEQRESFDQGFMARIGRIEDEAKKRQQEEETGETDSALDVVLPDKFPISLVCIALESIEQILDQLSQETEETSPWSNGLESREDAVLQERDLFEAYLDEQ